MRIIRLLLVVIMLLFITDVHAARMSDYADNTTPNADVYFIGVDPNDTSQTVRGSNYRYSLASILGSGLLDATFKSLTISGIGDSWLELENNTSFTDPLTGKYGIRFYNGVLQQIINGTASVIGSGGSAPTLQADDPDMSDATGWYLATGSGDLFYVNSGIGMWTFAGTYSGDVIDPVIGAVTPSALTHDGTGATLSVTIASITEANEDYRQWSLYDVTDAAIQTDWTTFTGLSISGITIPADQHTYRVDVRVYDLAGNTGAASSGDITHSAPSSYLFEWDAEDLTAEAFDVDDGGIITVGGGGFYSFVTGQTGNAIQIDSGSYVSFPATDGNNINWSGGTLSFSYRYDSGTPTSNTYIFSSPYQSPEQFSMRHSTIPGNYVFYVGGEYFSSGTLVENLFDGLWHSIDFTWNCTAQTWVLIVDGSTYSGSLPTTTPPAPTTGKLYFNGFNAASSAQQVTIDTVKIE